MKKLQAFIIRLWWQVLLKANDRAIKRQAKTQALVDAFEKTVFDYVYNQGDATKAE